MSNWLYDGLMSAASPRAPFIVSAEAKLTYADVDARAARMAGALRELGVGAGDRVLAQVEKSVDHLVLYLASVRAGAVFVPLNTAYTAAEVAYFIEDADPSLIVCDPARLEEARALAGRTPVETLGADGDGSLTSRAQGQKAGAVAANRAPDDLAAICYTSGTTGRSKGAMLTHEGLLGNARRLAALWRFTADDVLIHALPTYHVHGLFVATHVTMLAGASMILQPRFDAAEVLAAMSRASVLMGVPTFYTRLLAHPGLTRRTAGGMRLFVSGSAPLPPSTHKAWENLTGQRILERYGMTETGMNTSNPYAGPRLAGSVGPPLPDVGLRIVDEVSGQPLDEGATGLVQVRGPNVFSGYWRNPRKTAEAFTADGWFSTGDIGRLDADGYLWLVGRASDLVITGGLNVYPAEVEEAIDSLPGVIESAVIGLPHADLGEAVAAVVVGEESLTEADVLAGLRDRLARFKQPRRVLFVQALPRNAMGKVVKAELRRRYADRSRSPG